MKPVKPAFARRSSLLADLRIILLGSWGFLRQLFRSWRLAPNALDQSHDDRHEP
jgi:hypothetical protein